MVGCLGPVDLEAVAVEDDDDGLVVG